VDAPGLVLNVVVHPASVADRDGARLVLEGVDERRPDLSKLWVDAGYRGGFVAWARAERGLDVEVVTLPRRWVRVPADEEPPPLPSGMAV
jgi:putative transposase